MATVKGEKRNSTNKIKKLSGPPPRDRVWPRTTIVRPDFRVNFSGQERETERKTPPRMALANRHSAIRPIAQQRLGGGSANRVARSAFSTYFTFCRRGYFLKVIQTTLTNETKRGKHELACAEFALAESCIMPNSGECHRESWNTIWLLSKFGQIPYRIELTCRNTPPISTRPVNWLRLAYYQSCPMICHYEASDTAAILRYPASESVANRLTCRSSEVKWSVCCVRNTSFQPSSEPTVP